jgi:hypothetical protein
MKKLALILICSLLFFSFKTELVYTVKLTMPEWKKHITRLEGIRKIVDDSNLPNQEVKFVKSSIDSLEIEVIKQLQEQEKAGK